MECSFCIDNAPLSIAVAHINSKCKYHPRVAMTYDGASCAPPLLCRELFHAAYPVCLSLLYSGRPRPWRLRSRGERQATVSCPARDGVTLDIRVKEALPAPLRMLKELAEKACTAWYRPLDAHFRRVEMEVAAAGRGCPKAYCRGQRFAFNTHHTDELCPAGFAALYPYVRYVRRADSSGGVPRPLRIHCPDHAGVMYEVSASENVTAGTEAHDFSALCSRCNSPSFAGGEQGRRMTAFLPQGFCPLAMHSLYAYIRTLARGGWFNWVGHGERVIVHCPAPGGASFLVGQTSGGQRPAVTAEIKDAGTACPRSYGKGRRFDFAIDRDGLRTMETFDRELPAVLADC